MAEASDRDLGIQNDFFNQARKSRSRITILLNSGKRLAGRIKSFDRYTLILDAGGGTEELIFKHAIATITLGGRPHFEARHEPAAAVAQASAPAPAPAVETKSETS